MTFTKAELATILAALRFVQVKSNYLVEYANTSAGSALADIVSSKAGYRDMDLLLDDDEIDNLCETLNTYADVRDPAEVEDIAQFTDAFKLNVLDGEPVRDPVEAAEVAKANAMFGRVYTVDEQLARNLGEPVTTEELTATDGFEVGQWAVQQLAAKCWVVRAKDGTGPWMHVRDAVTASELAEALDAHGARHTIFTHDDDGFVLAWATEFEVKQVRKGKA